ncbi:alpha/beta hydrolase [Leptospira ilyithenensis]|uniref:Alpha/beta hydrolase n=1 Tax=Leptospira ilyithenensis TaxID=2484901 RepID=A0A4V3JX80_9LEPT|nr:alpha/beta hydrolase [Leptospira ilyithenensis]TGN12007.1 alpha/beta hydrolase [Leptospira ilyithenensis]
MTFSPYRILKFNQSPKLPILFFLLPLIFSLFDCATPPTIGQLLNERTKDSFDETKNLNINYVTTRRERTVAAPNCDSNTFDFLSDITTHYGECIIGIPAKHSIGDITWDNSQDKNSFFHLNGKRDRKEEDFFQKIKSNPFEEVLVFVHGFNVPFEEAVVRAGQIRYDLKFPGEVILYSWPAGTDAGIINQLMVRSVYEANFIEAKLNREPFADFLSKIIVLNKKVHLVVHSMGHQVVLPAIDIAVKRGKTKFLEQLILNAPDFDKVEFTNLAPNLVASSKRVTLYCSPGDNALIASQKVNGGSRAGTCFRFNDIDVINVNEVDSPVLGIGGLGHGYYSSRPILTDIYQVLLGVSIEKRLFIRRAGQYNGEGWILRK